MPTHTDDLRLYATEWLRDGDTLSALRRRVFVEEQGVSLAEEWDGEDETATHFLAELAGTPVATGRLLPSGKIGRLAVLEPNRGVGIGGQLLDFIIEYARQLGHRELVLHAQTHALAFYRRYGFQATGPEFMEAGIPHRRMVLLT